MGFLRLNDIEEVEPVPGCRVRFVHSDNMTLAYWNISARAIVPEHSHPHEQIVNIIEGGFELTVGSDRQIIEPGSVVVIPPDVPHSGRAMTDCRIIDAFYPVRDDYRATKS